MVKNDPSWDLLAEVGLFSGLAKAELRKVASLLKPLSFDAGQDIVVEGTPAGRFFLITRGSAEVTVDGQRRNGIGPGDHVGEISLIDQEPRTATVTALTPVETLSMTSFNFRGLLRDHPAITQKLLVSVCRRLRTALPLVDVKEA